MGNSRGSADSVIGDGPIWTEFFLAPRDEPVLIATVNMPSAPGAASISVVWTPKVQWAFVLERNDPHVAIALTVDGVSGKTTQRLTQFPRNNRHREAMIQFVADLEALRAPREKKEGKKDGSGPKQSDTTEEVPGGDSRVSGGDNEGRDRPGEATVPANDQ